MKMMPSVFHINLKQAKNMSINADNVHRIGIILETKGVFTTIDSKDSAEWRNFLCENNIFYTELKHTN